MGLDKSDTSHDDELVKLINHNEAWGHVTMEGVVALRHLFKKRKKNK